MSSRDKKILIFLSKVILITLLIVLLIRTFFIEPFTVSTQQMESSLLQGDKVLIDKTSYGIRLPITLLSIPFTFDNILGIKSYSSAVQLPYKRLFSSDVNVNDVVLFNNPMETERPHDKRTLLLSRCIGKPNDTLEIRNGRLLLNNNADVVTPYAIDEYEITHLDKTELSYIMDDSDIPLRSLINRGDSLFVLLNSYEAFIINDKLSDSLKIKKHTVDTTLNLKLVIPAKGKSIALNDTTLIMYKQVILQEQKEKAQIVDNKLYIDFQPRDEYTFLEDYYWMLSDNRVQSLDSHSLGFIPFTHVIGKVRYIWYSSGHEGIRRDRIFTKVK